MKSSQALGVVAHFRNGKSKRENRLEEMTWSCQYAKPKFDALAAQGVKLQNLVYYRSQARAASVWPAMHATALACHVSSPVARGSRWRRAPSRPTRRITL